MNVASKNLSALLIATAVSSIALAGSASAKSPSQAREDAIEKREAAQEQSIRDGRRDGSITIWERARLEREQRRIDRLEKNAEADGYVSKKEYREIKAAQDSAGRHIREEKNNEQVRGWWWRHFVR